MESKKILFTTSYINPREYYDYYKSNSPVGRHFDISVPRVRSNGLRFIRHNIPGIKILEYPTREEFLSVLKKGWDIVGFSFFLNETHEIMRMVKDARKAGVKEIWGGNYGVLTEGIEEHFDRIFIGYAEREIADALGVELKDIKHPPILYDICANPKIKLNRVGTLFTSRGCPLKCSFCQTPVFSDGIKRVNLQSIDEVLQKYKKIGVEDIHIQEENFLLLKKHAEDVIDLLDEYKMNWMAQASLEAIPDDLSEWIDKGFIGASIGIESLRQSNLDDIKKKRSVENVLRKINILQEKNRYIQGYYMIGFEDDTVESIKEDIKQLAKLRLDLTQVCVLTPLPKTPMAEYIKGKYGIFEKDYHKYDTKHLVWNHPNISPGEMQGLLNYAFKMCRPRSMPLIMGARMLKRYNRYNRLFDGVRYVFRHFLDSNLRKEHN